MSLHIIFQESTTEFTFETNSQTYHASYQNNNDKFCDIPKKYFQSFFQDYTNKNTYDVEKKQDVVLLNFPLELQTINIPIIVKLDKFENTKEFEKEGLKEQKEIDILHEKINELQYDSQNEKIKLLKHLQNTGMKLAKIKMTL
jgi:hypothetical protein